MAGKQQFRESEMKQKLTQAQEDLKKAKDQLEAMEEEKSRILDELKEMKKVAEDANLRLCEALMKQREVWENEKFRVDELERASFESAQKRDQAWQLELEAVQRQRDMDIQALASAAKELNRVNKELSLAVQAKNKALRESMEAKISSEAYAKRVKNLSLELCSLKELLESAATPGIETAFSDSEDEDEDSEESDESDASETSSVHTSPVIDLLKLHLRKMRGMEAKLAEKESLAEELEVELAKARETESQTKSLLSESKKRIETLQLELERASDSETKAFESLLSLTKQLEETKVSLEESKFKIVSLHKNIESMEISFGLNSRDTNASYRCLDTAKLDAEDKDDNDKGHESQLRMAKEEVVVEMSKVRNLRKEIRQLKNELSIATEAEEQSRKAMDELALVLKEVMTESTQVKKKLAVAEIEAENANAETEHTKMVLKSTEARFQGLLDDARKEIKRMEEAAERLKLEAEESHTAWNGKEVGFVHCMKMSEEEIADVKAENDMLIESLKEAEMASKMARDENSRLRDILKHALNEATVAKEGAEIARTENSQLKDNLAEMGSALLRLTQENDRLRNRERGSLDNGAEVKSSTSTGTASKPSSRRTLSLPIPRSGEVKNSSKKHDSSTKESKAGEEERKNQETLRQEYINQRIKQGYNDDDIDPELFKGSIFDTADSPDDDDDAYESFNGAASRKGPPSTLTDDEETIYSDDLDNVEGIHDETESNRSSEHSHRKKRALIRRFGDMLRRRSYA